MAVVLLRVAPATFGLSLAHHALLDNERKPGAQRGFRSYLRSQQASDAGAELAHDSSCIAGGDLDFAIECQEAFNLSIEAADDTFLDLIETVIKQVKDDWWDHETGGTLLDLVTCSRNTSRAIEIEDMLVARQGLSAVDSQVFVPSGDTIGCRDTTESVWNEDPFSAVSDAMISSTSGSVS
ncbi:hypothetical protein M406DRAFT_335273 [Cryphonectria parasitica EP155]|uniref:Uncharacterized protein n=1 Tax=Cryphonectria parasitica (strain ATCC 38755 / EP155) TaxID=660469 RepID=A0A9P5CHN7_CRYP1|nr:uncharacterized protein M406DRAFT_335273 [Cryphonectria parasitica EP155]KAF3760068.1 hypothetical protein M406DRAFT_335273 [Cryphonectria parasitica EP155]